MSAATVAIARPTLDVELEARNNCRYRLGGMECHHQGQTRRIRGTTWLAEPGLWVFLDDDRDPVAASELTLIGRWELACCPSKLRVDGLPRGCGVPVPRRPRVKPEPEPDVPSLMPADGSIFLETATLADVRRTLAGDRDLTAADLAGPMIPMGPPARRGRHDSYKT